MARPIHINTIVSGGQTGADRGALEAAIELGIDHGGWCPRGRRAEDGPIPDCFELTETDSADYAVRTRKNVVDSDGTLLVTRGPPTGGSALTAKLARRHSRPLLHLDLDATDPELAARAVRGWIAEHDICVINVAGPRASRVPDIARDVRHLLVATLT